MYRPHDNRPARWLLHTLALATFLVGSFASVDRCSAEAVAKGEQIARCDRAREQVAAAEKQFAKLKDTFTSGNTTVDILLDAQRRKLDAERVYLKLVDEYSEESVVKKHVLSLNRKALVRSHRDDIEYVLSVWREFDNSTEGEAQAREQYFFLRGQLKKIDTGPN